MNYEIKSRFDSSNVLFQCAASSWYDAVKQAIKAGANLSRADLSKANLSGANLSWANLSRVNLKKILSQRTIVPDGDIVGYKKLSGGTIAKLLIPADARRIGGLVGRKCRAEFVKVIEGSGISIHDGSTEYEPGGTVYPDSFDDNPLVECINGIHFFITRAEAEAH